MKKRIILLLLCCWVGFSQAQNANGANWIIGPAVGWQYQSGNFLKVGGWGLFAPNNYQYMKIHATANFTWMRSQTTVIPELGFTYYLSDRLIFPFVKAEVTPYTLTPKIGIGILSLIDLDLGYGFDMQTKTGFKPLKGISGGVTLNIPLNFYLKL